MDYESAGATLERVEDLGTSPRSVVKRWNLELKLADKREDDWRKKATKVLNRYRQKDAKKNSFNILWANTETLRPALYNSVPNPDVRRRFKDGDKLGKAVSEVLQRCISYSCDTYDFDQGIKSDVLDMLLPGRAVSRIRYIPTLEQVGVTPETHEEGEEQHEPAGEALEGDTEELTWEQVVVERVQWDDFRHGLGKDWNEVPWVGFRHKLTRDEMVEKFGEVGEDIPLDDPDDDDIRQEKDNSVADLFKTATIWEIWVKEDKQVLFICPSYKEAPAMEVDDPLNLVGFYPIPRPMYAVEDASSLVPTPLYELYKEQAEELDRISTRINKIIGGLKFRGIYDATITELSELMRGEDNDLIPSNGVTALIERGGLEKAIWFMPIEMAAKVLQILYEQRESAKKVIYEITGIADIVRGASVASETATAQSIKDKWSNIRLKRMQQEVQRYIRDLIRLKAEIIAEKFQLETLKQMTGLKFPMMAEKQQAMMQYQQAQMQAQQQAQMAQQQGQQAAPPQMPPPPPDVPAWEEIIEVLRDDAQRSYKVDIETDSTIAATVDQDMQSLQQVTQAMGVVLKEFMPLVQMGDLPVEAMKELLMTISRRARFGNALEDALDKMQQPPPKPQEQDNSAQVAQIKAQSDQQTQQADQQHSAQLEQMKMQHETQMEQGKQQGAAMVEQMRLEHASQLAQSQTSFDEWKAKLEAETKIAVAQISAQTSLKSQQMGIEAKEGMEVDEEGNAKPGKAVSAVADSVKTELSGLISTVNDQLQQLLEAQSTPRTIERGPDGRAISVGGRKIQRGPDNRIIGVQ